eukprot:g29796.t1
MSLAQEAARVALAGDLSSPVQFTLFGVDMILGFSPQFSSAGKVIGVFAVGQLPIVSKELSDYTQAKARWMN